MLANIVVAFAQDKNFATKKEYLAYSLKKFDINPEEIYYVSTQDKDTGNEPLEKFSLLMFFKNDSITTIEDASSHSACPAPKLIRQANISAIKKAMIRSKTAGTIVFKNMGNGTFFKPGKDEMVAVLFYSYKFGDTGQQYIKQRKKLSEELGIKTIILSIDGSYIDDLADAPKNKITLIQEN